MKSPPGSDSFTSLLDFVEALTSAGIYYQISSVRFDAILISVAAPGERWEIEFMRDGTLEVEIFVSDGEIKDDSSIPALFERFMDGPRI